MTSTAKSRMSCSGGPKLPIDFEALEHLAHGTSGIVYAIDEEWVLKEYWEPDDGTIERQVLSRLKPHPNIIRWAGEATSKSIILERGKPFPSTEQTDIGPIRTRVTWIRDAAEGLRHIHQHDIIHADFGCENMVIVDGRLKIIDFEGCSVDGIEATAAYKWYNRKDASVSLQSDIFAYGCVIYQILTGKPTFHELTKLHDRDKLAQRQWAENEFPDVHGLLLDDVMLRCWTGQFESMTEVISALDATLTRRSSVWCHLTNIWNLIVACIKHH